MDTDTGFRLETKRMSFERCTQREKVEQSQVSRSCQTATPHRHLPSPSLAHSTQAQSKLLLGELRRGRPAMGLNPE